MSELPKGWVETELGNVTNYGTTIKPDLKNIEGDCWVLELEDIERDSSRLLKRSSFAERAPKSSKNAFLKGDVLYGKLRPYLNKMLIAPEDGICTTEIVPLKVPSELFENRFLFYWLKGKQFSDYVNAVSYGVNMPRLGTKDGKKAPMVVAPLAEQKRIVEKLDEVLAQVDTIKARLDGIPELLKRFRQSVLASAVSGKLTEEWRGGAKFDVIESMLVELAKFIDYRGKTPKKTDSGVPLITAKNIKPGYISRTPEEFIAEDDYDGWMTRGFPKVGDILMTTEAPLGNVALIDIEEKFALAQRAICLQFTDERVKSEYACIYMRSMSFQEALLSNATGSTVKGIKASLLKKIVISYPEKEEQKEIVRLVDQYFAFADTIEAQVKKAQARVDNLTQSILAKAFRGELVEQDPNDEPADKLLERIAQARKEAEALAKAAKKAQSTKSTVKKKVAKSA
ncbi:restriction endonuclease subunit S [Vibrio parahaemolyticus]|nr:restriction endonuclease subunit S [Vibrio parahaemolyticus]EIU6802536.1 restriction endonuclease subunit S [Vibrio parahaemolyticus]